MSHRRILWNGETGGYAVVNEETNRILYGPYPKAATAKSQLTSMRKWYGEEKVRHWKVMETDFNWKAVA